MFTHYMHMYILKHAYSINFFVRSSRIRVDLLSYDSKPTDKREQNYWKAKKNLDG